MPVNDRPRIPQRHPVILPILHALFYHPHHLPRRHRWPGGNLPRLLLPRRQHLDVRAPHIDHQNSATFPRLPVFHHRCPLGSPSLWSLVTYRQAISRVAPLLTPVISILCNNRQRILGLNDIPSLNGESPWKMHTALVFQWWLGCCCCSWRYWPGALPCANP